MRRRSAGNNQYERDGGQRGNDDEAVNDARGDGRAMDHSPQHGRASRGR